jgi:tetratricopeptide (TPR) repeat protein
MEPTRAVQGNRARPNYLKWGLLLAGVGMILATVLATAALIITPLVFRNLSAGDQQRVVRRLPFLRVFLPTSVPSVVIIPTIVVTAEDALALLATETTTETTTATATAIPPTSTLAPTPTPTLIPTTLQPPTQPPTATPMPTDAPTDTPTSVPTDVPALTDTPLPTPIPTEMPTRLLLTASPTTPPATLPPPTTQMPPTEVPTQTLAVVARTSLPTNTPRPTDIPPSPTALPTWTPTVAATATPLPVITATPFLTFTPVPPSATPFPTLTPLPTDTPLPTPTFTDVPPTLIATPAELPVEPTFSLVGRMRWEPQLWNNCGPANLLQVLRFLEWRDNQANVASFIKPTQDDKNTSPSELVHYVNTRTTLRALYRHAGSLGLLKRLVSQQFGVIVETGYLDPEEPDEGWIGHYKTLLGYDDGAQLITWLDTLKDVQTGTYAAVEDYWRHFNRVYIVVYPPEREAELMAILGPNADESYNARQSLDLALAEARANPTDAYAWFNLGSSFVMLKRYQEAALAYDKAFSLGTLPYRHTWYQFGFYEAYYQTRRFDLLVALADYNIERTKGHEETPFYWRGMAYAATGRTSEAIAEFQAALAFNKLFRPAAEALGQVQAGSFVPPAP